MKKPHSIPFKRTWIPNSVTAFSAFLGYLSIIYALQGQFVLAAWLIVIAGILDMMDGKLARMCGGESKFGSYFDSLADAINYGVATSLLFYRAYFVDMGLIGGIISFLPTVCGTIRLARFNVLTETTSKSEFFMGLPTTVAAGFMASFIIFRHEMTGNYGSPVMAAALLALASLLMVSAVPYEHNSAFIRRNKKVLLLVFALATLVPFGGRALFVWVALYVTAGLTRSVVHTVRERRLTAEAH